VADAKWSDDVFLDGLRRQGDPEADEAVRRIVADGGERAAEYVFRVMRVNDDPIPPEAPAPLREFMATTGELPPDVDVARLERGGHVFFRHAVPAAIVLLASSLPRGYAAPCLCEILGISRDLQRHPYDRLMGVLQLLVNISNAKAFKPRGRAVLTAQKLRLLHAGVRSIAPRYRPGYTERFGVPVNHEDMLGTVMGFSWLVLDGMRRLGLGLTAQHEEDYYYLWRVFSLLMGIHPPGRPHDDSLIPASVADAEAFYASYARRNDSGPEANPYGRLLTLDNLAMMENLLPRWLRRLGFRYAPRVAMGDLMTPEELARVGFRPLSGHGFLRAVFRALLWTAQGVTTVLPFSALLAQLMFKGMIDTDRGGEVTFSIPFTVLGLRAPALE
jgi:hypothetical protein